MASELAEKLFGAVEAVADAAYSKGMQEFVEHGAHELAAALFGNGVPFVMYPRGGKEDAAPEVTPGLDNQVSVEPPQPELERGGGRSL